MIERDRVLQGALQANPRASWAEIGRALHISPPTARRHWERIHSAGDAWVTTYPGDGSGVVTGTMEMQIQPGLVDEVVRQLVLAPNAYTVTTMTGGRDISVLVFAQDMPSFRRVVQSELPRIAGITSTTVAINTRFYSDGADWSREPAHGEVRRQSLNSRIGEGFHDPLLRELLSALETDGRRALRDISEEIGVRPEKARRRLEHAIRSRELRQRVDMSHRLSEWHLSVALWMQVPSAHMDAVSRRISSHASVRLTASVTGGAANLYVIAWVRSLDEAPRVETEIISHLPAVVLDRSLIVQYHKRLGWIHDEEGRRTQLIPWTAALPVAAAIR